MQDPNTCDHAWQEDGTLEVFPPIAVAHCGKCGLRRHVKTASGEVTYLPPGASGTGEPSRPVSNLPARDPDNN